MTASLPPHRAPVSFSIMLNNRYIEQQNPETLK